MNNKIKTEEVPLTGPELVGKIFELLLKIGYEEVNKFLLHQKETIKENVEELVNDIEDDILLGNLSPKEIRMVEERTIKEKEWINDLYNSCYDEITANLLYLLIYKIIRITDKELLILLLNETISEYDALDDIDYVIQSVYEKFKEVLVKSKDEQLLNSIMEQVKELTSKGIAAKIYVEPDYSTIVKKEDDSKFKA